MADPLARIGSRLFAGLLATTLLIIGLFLTGVWPEQRDPPSWNNRTPAIKEPRQSERAAEPPADSARRR